MVSGFNLLLPLLLAQGCVRCLLYKARHMSLHVLFLGAILSITNILAFGNFQPISETSYGVLLLSLVLTLAPLPSFLPTAGPLVGRDHDRLLGEVGHLRGAGLGRAGRAHHSST